MGLKGKCLGFYSVSLKVEEDQELNIVFTAVTQISAKRHFWRWGSNHGVFGIGQCLGFRNRVLRLRMTLEPYT